MLFQQHMLIDHFSNRFSFCSASEEGGSSSDLSNISRMACIEGESIFRGSTYARFRGHTWVAFSSWKAKAVLVYFSWKIPEFQNLAIEDIYASVSVVYRVKVLISPVSYGPDVTGLSSPAWPLGSAESLPRCHFRVQVVKDTLVRDFAWVFHLEFLLDFETNFLLCNGKHSSLHKRVHHSVFDRLACCRWTREDEKNRALLLAIMVVFEAVEGKSWLGRRKNLGQLGDGAWRRRFGYQLDNFGFRVDFLDHVSNGLLLWLDGMLLTSIVTVRPPSSPTSFMAAMASSPTGMLRFLLR